MKTRLFVALIAVLIAVFGVSNAQDFNPCFSLSEEDCALIGEATTNSGTTLLGSTSVTIDFELSASATDIPESDPVSFSVTGTIDAVQNTEAQVPFNVYGAFDVAADMEGESQEASVEFWLVDDVFYFVNPDDQSLNSVDLIRLMEETDFEAMITEAASDPTSALGNAGLDESALTAIGGLITLPGLLDYVRDGDDFIFTVDLGALTDPNNEEALAALVAAITEADPEAGAQLEAYLPMLPMMLENGVISFTQGLNTDLNLVDVWALEGNFVVASGMLMGDATLPSTTVDFGVYVGMGNFDGVEEITAPEGATDITDTAIELFSSSMGAVEGGQ